MIPTGKYSLNVLRLGLILSTIGWGITLLFTVSTWHSAADYMYAMGAGQVDYNPLMDYWMRMASVVMGCIGIASFMAARKPDFYAPVIYLLGPFNYIVGITLIFAAINNELTPDKHPTFIPDIVFCFMTGSLIICPLVYARGTNK